MRTTPSWDPSPRHRISFHHNLRPAGPCQHHGIRALLSWFECNSCQFACVLWQGLYRYLDGLAEAVSRAGGQIFEQNRVQRSNSRNCTTQDGFKVQLLSRLLFEYLNTRGSISLTGHAEGWIAGLFIVRTGSGHAMSQDQWMLPLSQC